MKLESFETWLILNTHYQVRESQRENKDAKDFILDSGYRVFILEDKLAIEARSVDLSVHYDGKAYYSLKSQPRNHLTYQEKEALRVMQELTTAWKDFAHSEELNET